MEDAPRGRHEDGTVTARGRVAMVALAAATALAALYGGLWLYGASALDEGIERWAAERRAEGWRVAFGTKRAAGFPFRLVQRIGGPSLARIIGGKTRRWRGPEIEVEFVPWRPDEIRLRFPGTHHIDLDTAGRARTLTLDVASAGAVIRRDSGGAARTLTLDLTALTVRRPGKGSPAGVERLTVTIETAPRAASGDDRGASARLMVKLGGLTLPAGSRPALGHRIASLALDAAVMGRLAAGPLRETLAAWRDAGGTIELTRFSMVWSDLALDADGTLALDAEMQPMGAMTVRITGFRQAVDALVAAGMLRPHEAITAKIVLGLLATTPPGGGPPRITAPLTVQDGGLYVGPVKMLRLPRIRWK